MGVVNVAVTSDGTVYSSESIERKRRQYASHRQRLQLRGTRNAKRRIRKAGRKESRFRRDVNHRIAKEIVRTAKGTSRGIAVEDLNGINRRTTVGRSQRSRRMGWSFFQLRTFIDYKAAEALVPFVAVDPKDTSRRCSCCGHTEKGNRRSQSAFRCLSCGFVEDADLNAARNIAFRAAVNQPIAATTGQSASPTASALGR